MADRKTSIYIAEDVMEILEEVNPKSVSRYFNECVREHHMWQEQLNRLCADVTEIKSLLNHVFTKPIADQTRR